MKTANLPASLMREINTMIAKCEAISRADPEMRDVAAMVYIGDIYSLTQDTRGIDTMVESAQPYASNLDIDVI